MPRKVILDVDPGIDDAVALILAMFDPALEVVAVTAVAGNVGAEAASRNVQALVEQLDPVRWPRLGKAAEPEHDPQVDSRHLFGSDGLGDAGFPVAELHHQHPSDKVIADQIRQAPDEVTLVALGPLTNVAGALRREPSLAGLVGQIVIMGGAVAVNGNVTPAAEFNIYCDPPAARYVFRSLSTKTVVPLDITSRVVFNYDLLEQLPPESTRAGRVLRRILPHAFRTHRQKLGLEGVYLHDVVALLAVTRPDLFTTQRLAADVEVSGEITTGATVFDRRSLPDPGLKMEVALDVDVEGVIAAVVEGLAAAGAASGQAV